MSGGLLALDTATEAASVAFAAAGEPIHCAVEAGARRLAAEIVNLVARVLRESGRRPADLTGIIVGDGPGSFTGVRIAWSAAKGLAHEHRIPLWCAPSLLGLARCAWGADEKPSGAPVVACYDALRGQVFAAMYGFHERRVEVLVPPALFTVATLARVAPCRPVIVAGDGARRYADEFYAWTAREPVDRRVPIQPTAIGLLDIRGWEGGASPVIDPLLAAPTYGRPAEAQVRWEARHGRRLPYSAGEPD